MSLKWEILKNILLKLGHSIKNADRFKWTSSKLFYVVSEFPVWVFSDLCLGATTSITKSALENVKLVILPAQTIFSNFEGIRMYPEVCFKY